MARHRGGLGLARRAGVVLLPGERLPTSPPASRPRFAVVLCKWVATLTALGACFAALSLTLPPHRSLDSIAIGLLAVATFATTVLLFVRADKLRLGRMLLVTVAALVLSGVAVALASNPPGGAVIDVHIDRQQWLLVIAALLVPAIAIRRLVEELRRRAAELVVLARTDHVTGVGNHLGWEEELGREVARARRDHTGFCIALLDIDHLKAFNEMRGHAGGDGLLRRASQAWRATLRGSDVLAHLGAGRFGTVLRRCSIESAVVILERMRMCVPDEQTVSVGLAVWDGHETPKAVQARASSALDAAKRAGRNRLKYADAEAVARPVSDDWGPAIRRLLDDRSVVSAYQPIVSLTDGTIVAYEALARPDRSRVDISVDRLFEAAQHLGLARDLDWLCRRAALAGAGFQPKGMPLFVNCNVGALVDPLHRVDQMLLVTTAAGRRPQDVVLEITERELVGDMGRLRSVVDTYRRAGFRFAFDDVGEGHSTLEVLAATMPEFVKIARSLSVEVGSSGPRAAVRALVSFASETGSLVIAEGIESLDTAKALAELGVGLAQGYLFGRPALPEAIAAALATGPPAIPVPVVASRPRVLETPAPALRPVDGEEPIPVPAGAAWAAGA